MRLIACLVASVLLHGLLLVPWPIRPAPAVPTLLVELPPPAHADTADLARPPVPMPEAQSSRPAVAAQAASAAPAPAATPAAPKRVEPERRVHADVRRVQEQLMRRLLYPPEAVAQGLEGEVIVLLRLDKSGHVLDVSISRSSGHALLDDAAKRALVTLGRQRGDARELLIPVVFALD